VAKDGESVATVGAAEIIGEHALITETRRNADVVATEPTSIIASTSREFGALLAACPNLSSNVQGLAASRED
jgi:CRP-like cAMP-binding protein